MMVGLKAYLSGNMKQFTFWFAISAPLKYFSILIYIPLVLLKEKRIHRILLQGVLVVLPILFFWIAVPYGRAELVEGCTFSGSSSGTNIAKPIYDAMFVTGSIGFGTLYIYIFAWVVFLILCYCYPVQEKNNYRIPIYVCYAAYTIQFTFGYSHPYWLILMVPFMVLLILMDERHRYINLLLELVGTAAMAWAQIFTYTWCFKSNILNLSFWKDILPAGVAQEDYSVITVLSRYIQDPRLQEYAAGIGLSVYGACILIFSLLNFPLWKRELPVLQIGRGNDYWLLPLRAVIVLGIGLSPLVLYVFHAIM